VAHYSRISFCGKTSCSYLYDKVKQGHMHVHGKTLKAIAVLHTYEKLCSVSYVVFLMMLVYINTDIYCIVSKYFN